MKTRIPKIKVIDLFCGIGGLSYGLIKEGLDVIAGIDNDKNCKYGFEYNNGALFIEKDILDVTAKEIDELFGDKKGVVRVLAGCAPCQPFSKLNIKRVTKKHLEPLEKFDLPPIFRSSLKDSILAWIEEGGKYGQETFHGRSNCPDVAGSRG